jgi:dihydrofolate synthase/folylpolyglutamate synthase
MSIIGNPFKSFKSIHVTGTNGKGSVSIKTAKIVENAGYKVGLYTSPHLFTFR